MITIISKDSLRNRVERASGGRQTVLYTQRGQASYMNVISRHDVGMDAHPAFMLAGRQKQEFLYGSYGGVLRDGELLSLPGQQAASGLNFDQAMHSARVCGPGWHLATNAERAALILCCRLSRHVLRGNTDQGRDAQGDHGQRLDGGSPGSPGGDPATLTGSGPDAWRHDGRPHGIADLCGNLWEWTAGLRLQDGEIQIIADNDAALHSCAWQAIRLADGLLVPPGSAGTAKFDAPQHKPDGNAGAPLLAERIHCRAGLAGDNRNTAGLMDAPFSAIRSAGTGEPPAIFKDLGLYPAGHADERAQVYLRNYGERLMLSGGAWYSGPDAGLNALCLSHPRHHASTTVGARPAFLL